MRGFTLHSLLLMWCILCNKPHVSHSSRYRANSAKLFLRTAGGSPSSCRSNSDRLVLRGGGDLILNSTSLLESPSNEFFNIDESFNESKLVEVFNSVSNCDTLEQMYKTVLQRNPTHVPTLHNYGNLLMKVRHNYTAAEDLYRKALGLDPHHVPSLCNYGNLLHNHFSNSNEAESMYLKALKCDPAHATTLCNYGLFVQNVKRDTLEAESWYRKALESDPQHSTTLYNYGRLIQV
jgi:Tfp pilus assembly protein PilF